ncbi:GTP-binding protein [Bacillus shivajii]|uniref:GTP-binding protein n=1 Tax=Bacillus shivajii TaxID=1983719 RepID=UPI001CFAFE29|nr:GTP-binding protein [Bacillus shivajii]UCZ52473.1 GTP-binding protein [Bacillus shivajii]
MNEDQLIQKVFYKTYMEENENRQPLQVLGEAFFTEQKKDEADLPAIRFAQGEVYYHNKDLEAAIYKWENVNNDLKAWAKKNIGDAYYELGWLNEAEKVYTSIETDSTVLSVETSLQLVSLYSDKNNLERVYQYIHKAISIDPDYPDVTELARTFYEDQEDDQRAVELAVSESIRTASVKWFDVLKGYIDKGYTKDFPPSYFQEILKVVYEVDERMFSQITKALWNNYKKRDTVLAWVHTANILFSEIGEARGNSRYDLSVIHYECYLELMSGEYLLSQLETVVPSLLSNWLNFTNEKSGLFPAAAIMAWNEYFPASLNGDTLKESERVLFDFNHDEATMNETLDLLQSLLTWAESNQLQMGEKTRWVVSRFADLNKKFMLVTGTVGSGKSSVINSILQEELVGEEPATMFIKPSETRELIEVTEEGNKIVHDISNLKEDALLELEWQSPILQQLDCSLISSPKIIENIQQEHTPYDYLNLVDGLLYIIDTRHAFQEEELQVLLEIYERAPDLKVHFLLHDADGTPMEKRGLQEARSKINQLFPEAKVISYSSFSKDGAQAESLVKFLNERVSIHKESHHVEQKTTRALSLIRLVLSELMTKRTAMEDSCNENVVFNEDIIGRLKALVNTLNDTEHEKVRTITESYRAVKEGAKHDVRKDLPKLLRECAEEIKEDSDFRVLHDELNDVMNKKIKGYLEEQIMPKLSDNLQQWLNDSENELRETQQYLDETSESLNALYEQNKIKLNCDFQTISDWRRDINRFTHRIEIGQENIMNRQKPTQLLLKSAGKLFGNIQHNNNMLFSQYKKHVENSDYEDVTHSIIHKFFLEFDLFEKALKADVSIFFEEPFEQLNRSITEAESERDSVKRKLEIMKENPHLFYDPMKIFEVRLLQCEIMKKTSENDPNVIY